ncbi:UDP-N-acetylglucosamine 2-epimerase [Parageobacillus toebii]|uniref:UDP-N-acetylglucosamine 2-epimerase n=1 Tax=Parageobacillus toebii TaxID=153151 RepID=UPI0035C75654
MKRVAYITGTRADFGRMYYTLKEIEKNSNLELLLIVTGMHLSEDYGLTIQEIEKEFKVSAKVDMLISNDEGSSMAQSLGLAIINLTQVLKIIKPDILLLLGDRGEMLAGAIAAAHMNIPIVHIAGGDVSGTIDESIRHAISKFSHFHLTSTKEHAERLMSMGEEPHRIKVVGAPDLDAIKHMCFLDKDTLSERLKVKLDSKFLILAFHPVTTELKDLENQFYETIEAIKEIGLQTIIIQPNSDAGNQIIRRILAKEYSDKFFIYNNIPYREFLSLLSHASVLVGNTSSGIIEAPSLGVPFVNIGNRQQGRMRAKNVIDVPPNKKNIYQAIEKALNDQQFLSTVKKRENPYGDGYAYKRITDFIINLKIDKNIFSKKFYEKPRLTIK